MIDDSVRKTKLRRQWLIGWTLQWEHSEKTEPEATLYDSQNHIHRAHHQQTAFIISRLVTTCLEEQISTTPLQSRRQMKTRDHESELTACLQITIK